MFEIKKVGAFWVDKNNNRWRTLRYDKKEAIAACKTMKDCANCFDCENCSECYNCTSCKNCRKCFECEACANCVHCTGCDSCHNCADCHACTLCGFSSRCSECSSCKQCNHCYGCADCMQCLNCSNTAYRTLQDDEVQAKPPTAAERGDEQWIKKEAWYWTCACRHHEGNNKHSWFKCRSKYRTLWLTVSRTKSYSRKFAN